MISKPCATPPTVRVCAIVKTLFQPPYRQCLADRVFGVSDCEIADFHQPLPGLCGVSTRIHARKTVAAAI